YVDRDPARVVHQCRDKGRKASQNTFALKKEKVFFTTKEHCFFFLPLTRRLKKGSDHDVLPPSHAITDTDTFNTQNRICT
ncbi:hypothetical protein M5D96_000259, partial [Drosophila gunungcola]